jgi:sulfhydrogenase subunit alpha
MGSIPKIEGHATFYAHLKAGRIDKARIIGLDGERFVESILVGRKYYEAPVITSRICGICPVIHNVTSTKAIEAACGIEISKQTKELRKLMLCGQMIQSHSLHLYLLVLPDFVGASSSFELQKTHPDLFQNAVTLKKYSDLIVQTVGGRAVHPVSNVPGGFKKIPELSDLKKILDESENIIEISKKTLALFASFDYPQIERKMIYSALYKNNDYAYYDGVIQTTSGNTFEAKDYHSYVYEELKPYNRAKFATLQGEEMMVGAMARYNLSRGRLNHTLVGYLKTLGITKKEFDNPFNNILAQAIEILHFVRESQGIINGFVRDGLKAEKLVEPKKFGIGVSACEAPRGTLFHSYSLDKEGYITKCDIITPTVQNLASTEKDMRLLSPIIKGMKPAERNATIEMLIRGYDPCITCATH